MLLFDISKIETIFFSILQLEYLQTLFLSESQAILLISQEIKKLFFMGVAVILGGDFVIFGKTGGFVDIPKRVPTLGLDKRS